MKRNTFNFFRVTVDPWLELKIREFLKMNTANFPKRIIFTLFVAIFLLNKVTSDTLERSSDTYFKINLTKIKKLFKRITACVEYAKDKRIFSPTTIRTLTFNPS